MIKTDLLTGDIIVTKAGYLGVVLKSEGYILYQTMGVDLLDELNDDLTYAEKDFWDNDIMEVYRGCSFIELDYVTPIWKRKKSWQRPTEEEIKIRENREKWQLKEKQLKVLHEDI